MWPSLFNKKKKSSFWTSFTKNVHTMLDTHIKLSRTFSFKYFHQCDNLTRRNHILEKQNDQITPFNGMEKLMGTINFKNIVNQITCSRFENVKSLNANYAVIHCSLFTLRGKSQIEFKNCFFLLLSFSLNCCHYEWTATNIAWHICSLIWFPIPGTVFSMPLLQVCYAVWLDWVCTFLFVCWLVGSLVCSRF